MNSYTTSNSFGSTDSNRFRESRQRTILEFARGLPMRINSVLKILGAKENGLAALTSTVEVVYAKARG